MAKELALEQGFGNRRAVDCDKSAAAFGRLVQALRKHLLAGATLTQQHHGRVAAGHALDHPTQAQHLRVAGQQAGQRIGLVQGLQSPVLGLQLEQPESPVYRQSEQLGLEGLGEEIVGAERNSSQRVGLVVLPGQHDHLGVRVDLQQLLEQPEALADRIGVWRQSQVHRHHRRLVATRLHQRRLAVAGRDGLETVERPFDLFLQREVVLDNQQRCLCNTHAAVLRSEPVRRSNNGSNSVTTEPWPSSLFTSMLPPSSLTY